MKHATIWIKGMSLSTLCSLLKSKYILKSLNCSWKKSAFCFLFWLFTKIFFCLETLRLIPKTIFRHCWIERLHSMQFINVHKLNLFGKNICARLVLKYLLFPIFVVHKRRVQQNLHSWQFALSRLLKKNLTFISIF